jgi:hypothetical protein
LSQQAFFIAYIRLHPFNYKGEICMLYAAYEGEINMKLKKIIFNIIYQIQKNPRKADFLIYMVK